MSSEYSIYYEHIVGSPLTLLNRKSKLPAELDFYYNVVTQNRLRAPTPQQQPRAVTPQQQLRTVTPSPTWSEISDALKVEEFERQQQRLRTPTPQQQLRTVTPQQQAINQPTRYVQLNKTPSPTWSEISDVLKVEEFERQEQEKRDEEVALHLQVEEITNAGYRGSISSEFPQVPPDPNPVGFGHFPPETPPEENNPVQPKAPSPVPLPSSVQAKAHSPLLTTREKVVSPWELITPEQYHEQEKQTLEIGEITPAEQQEVLHFMKLLNKESQQEYYDNINDAAVKGRHMGPVGFTGGGNLCFLNACVQAIANCDSIFKEKFNQIKNANIPRDDKEVFKFLSRVLISRFSESSFTLIPLLSFIEDCSNKRLRDLFEDGRQQDTGEFMITFMEFLDECLQKGQGSLSDKVGCTVTTSINQQTGPERKETAHEFVTQVVIPQYGERVPFKGHIHPPKYPAMIPRVFKDLTITRAEGILTNDGLKTTITKRTDCKDLIIYDILRIQSATVRLEGNKYGGTQVMKRYDPIEYEDMMMIEGKEYQLVAVIHHLGEPEFGHYTADILAGKNWYNMNDKIVTPLTRFTPNPRSVKMLFYLRLKH